MKLFLIASASFLTALDWELETFLQRDSAVKRISA